MARNSNCLPSPAGLLKLGPRRGIGFSVLVDPLSKLQLLLLSKPLITSRTPLTTHYNLSNLTHAGPVCRTHGSDTCQALRLERPCLEAWVAPNA